MMQKYLTLATFIGTYCVILYFVVYRDFGQLSCASDFNQTACDIGQICGYVFVFPIYSPLTLYLSQMSSTNKTGNLESDYLVCYMTGENPVS